MDPFIGEIRPVAFNFAPIGWALCNGQLMSISQNTALFSLLGTSFGGDGRSTFGLPNLQGNVPLGAGQGEGLSFYDLGEIGGSQSVTVLTSELPQHQHTMAAGSNPADEHSPVGNIPGVAARPVYATTEAGTLAGASLQLTGGAVAHNNMQPYLTVIFVIALEGVFPERP